MHQARGEPPFSPCSAVVVVPAFLPPNFGATRLPPPCPLAQPRPSELVVVIKGDCVRMYCEPACYWTVMPTIHTWPNLEVYCMNGEKPARARDHGMRRLLGHVGRQASLLPHPTCSWASTACQPHRCM